MSDVVEFDAHPVADLFPLMSVDELTGLVEDVRSHGLREPIWLHPDGRIIDGRNRYRACLGAGVEPTFRTWNGEGSLIDFVLSLNLHRRHLSQSQKAALAVKVEEQYAAEAKNRQREAGENHGKSQETPGPKLVEIVPQGSGGDAKSRERAGKALGVSGRYVQDAKKIAEQAPDLMSAVESGEMTLPKATQEMNRRNDNASDPKPKKATKRQPLVPFTKSAGWALRRAVERIERIVDDDRFAANRGQVAAHLSGHLEYTVRACQEVLDRITDQPQED